MSAPVAVDDRTPTQWARSVEREALRALCARTTDWRRLVPTRIYTVNRSDAIGDTLSGCRTP